MTGQTLRPIRLVGWPWLCQCRVQVDGSGWQWSMCQCAQKRKRLLAPHQTAGSPRAAAAAALWQAMVMMMFCCCKTSCRSWSHSQGCSRRGAPVMCLGLGCLCAAAFAFWVWSHWGAGGKSGATEGWLTRRRRLQPRCLLFKVLLRKLRVWRRWRCPGEDHRQCATLQQEFCSKGVKYASQVHVEIYTRGDR